MKIGYYLAATAGNEMIGGSAPYSWRVIETLLKSTIPVDFHLFIDRSQQQRVNQLVNTCTHRKIGHSIVYQSRTLELLGRPVEQVAINLGKHSARRVSALANHIEWQMVRHRIDIVHCPLQHMPLFCWRRPVVVTMHDVQELHFPEFFSPHERATRATKHWWSLETATKVVVSFHHIKDDLIRYFRLAPNQIHVCSVPISNNWLPQHPNNLHQIEEKYGINEDFILYPAQTWQHKNHIRLIQALAYLRESGFPIPILVCTGRKSEYFATIEQEIARTHMSDKVRFLGIVPDQDLTLLYKKCASVVIPTLYEAGSFPLIEAMMLQAPVICARTTSLPETIGDAQFTFDPCDYKDIARSVKEILSDESLRQANVQNSQQRVQQLSNQHAETINAFQQLYESVEIERR